MTTLVLTWCQEPGSTPTAPRVSLFNKFRIQYSTHFPKLKIFGTQYSVKILLFETTLVSGAWLDSHCPRVSLFTPDSAPTPVSTVGAESGRGEAPESQRASAGASLTLTEPEPSLSLYSDISERGASILCLQLHFHC